MKNTNGFTFYNLNAKISLRRKLRGLDYWRYFEFPLVYWRLNLYPGCKILDVGSWKSVFPLYLVSKKKYEVYATDVFEEVLWQESAARNLGYSEEIEKGNFKIKIEDCRSLSFEDSVFDRISVISVLEHIYGEGDSQAIMEFSRVLKPGGILVVTVPFCPIYREEYVVREVYGKKSSKGKTFFQRRYDLEKLSERLLICENLEIRTIDFFGKYSFSFGKFADSLPHYVLEIPFDLFVPFVHKVFQMPLVSFENLVEIKNKTVDARGVCITFQKR